MSIIVTVHTQCQQLKPIYFLITRVRGPRTEHGGTDAFPGGHLLRGAPAHRVWEMAYGSDANT